MNGKASYSREEIRGKINSNEKNLHNSFKNKIHIYFVIANIDSIITKYMYLYERL